MQLKYILQVSLLKSLYFNIKYFGIKGLRLPVIIAQKCRLHLRGDVEIKNYTPGTVKIGFGGSEGIVENRYSFLSVARGARIIFDGKAGISSGNSIRVDAGTLRIGENFSSNKNCFLACSKGISIGKDVTLGWNVNIRDNDGHTLIDKSSNTVSESLPVEIGGHVWICSYSDLLKGTVIPPDSVVAYRSLVTHSFEGSNLLIGGVPAKILKENIDWKY